MFAACGVTKHVLVDDPAANLCKRGPLFIKSRRWNGADHLPSGQKISGNPPAIQADEYHAVPEAMPAQATRKSDNNW